MDRITGDTPNNPEEKNSQDSSAGKAYDVLCEIRDAFTRSLNARLSAAGFGDLAEGELLTLAAMHLSRLSSRELIRQLGITSQAASQSFEKLILHGYLGFSDNPDKPRQSTITITERGHVAFKEAQEGLGADQPHV
jgi:DNA-binding MarR family transcriptional regulator